MTNGRRREAGPQRAALGDRFTRIVDTMLVKGSPKDAAAGRPQQANISQTGSYRRSLSSNPGSTAVPSLRTASRLSGSSPRILRIVGAT